MKIHIENIHITIGDRQPVPGIISAFSLGNVPKEISELFRAEAKPAAPEIGQKWPGIDATYAGISLSGDGQRLVHLVLWDDNPSERMNHADAVSWAEGVNPQMASHLPTRHQGITLMALREHFDLNAWYQLLDKGVSGNTAFFQHFFSGGQDDFNLSYEGRVRAVSEIPL